jgi:hypothetical protein
MLEQFAAREDLDDDTLAKLIANDRPLPPVPPTAAEVHARARADSERRALELANTPAPPPNTGDYRKLLAEAGVNERFLRAPQ